MIKAKSNFKRRSTANNVQIIIPVPADADSPSFNVRASGLLAMRDRLLAMLPIGSAYTDCHVDRSAHSFLFCLQAPMGSCKYAPEQSAVVWTIKNFPGGKEFFMKAHFSLPSVEGEEAEARPPIQVKFEIPYFTTSGIQVRTPVAWRETTCCWLGYGSGD